DGIRYSSVTGVQTCALPISFNCSISSKNRLDEYFNEANMNRFFEEMEQLNDKTLTRVQSILGPDQLSEFQRLQQEHLEKGKTTEIGRASCRKSVKKEVRYGQ